MRHRSDGGAPSCRRARSHTPAALFRRRRPPRHYRGLCRAEVWRCGRRGRRDGGEHRWAGPGSGHAHHTTRTTRYLAPSIAPTDHGPEATCMPTFNDLDFLLCAERQTRTVKRADIHVVFGSAFQGLRGAARQGSEVRGRSIAAQSCGCPGRGGRGGDARSGCAAGYWRSRRGSGTSAGPGCR
jgi:hypothetical protein